MKQKNTINDRGRRVLNGNFMKVLYKELYFIYFLRNIDFFDQEQKFYSRFHHGKTKDYWISDIGDKPEHDPLNNNNYIYVFRNIKTPNFCVYVSFINHECLYC